ncbi:histidinol-phosphatase HisJ [Desulfospira joergensenii]|uniref:histidinol-phosphatase HisJ n=1 Tax=Desulfospira joergensenii TaxID=53329 RepID=UPI0003B58A76|nr:histidinol-phosphatase HisJ [Desulfospira joergensenii]
MENTKLISLHGGHSGEFCNHARDRLEEIVQAYIKKGFKQVGISEHIPPLEDHFLFPEEIKAGLTARDIRQRFLRYFETLDRLKEKYGSEIRIFRGMETEVWHGYPDQVRDLIQRFRPDYIVGSVHHLKGRCIDFSREIYNGLAEEYGGIEAMYRDYFDCQFEMIQTLKPFVVGHFDLIRIFDPDYKKRILDPSIQEKINRNLNLIKSLGLVMDLNLRPLSRGEDEPYPTRSIMEQIRAAGIPMVPGDDAHSADQAGGNVKRAVDLLESMGFDTDWPLERMKVDG